MKDIDFEGDGTDLDDFTNEDMEHFKRGGRDIPRKYRAHDDLPYYEPRRTFKIERAD